MRVFFRVSLAGIFVGAVGLFLADAAFARRHHSGGTQVARSTGKERAGRSATTESRSSAARADAVKLPSSASPSRGARSTGAVFASEATPVADERALEPHRHSLSVVSPVDLLQFGNQSLRDVRGPGFVERHALVRRGETFSRLLRMYDVSRDRASAFERAARQAYDLSRIRPRRSVSLFFERQTDELAAVEYSIDERNVLVIERGPDGELEARLARTPSSVEIRGVSGTIGESMAIDCSEAGVPERIVSELTDIFAWDVDFDALRPGDSFRALYEVALGEDGEVLQTGAIVAAEIESDKHLFTALYHTDEDGLGSYLDPEGRALERGQLRFPLEFTRISSEFSESRFHPILHRNRPHNGVDFAAPTGTPVRAIADGVVAQAGWQNELGYAVRLDHSATLPYDSLYGHLSRISRNAAPGEHVREGEIIGYVGQTGCATGPHLHFALLAGDEYVDPLRVSPPPRLDARVPLGSGFDRSRGVLLAALDSLKSDGPVRLTRMSPRGGATPLLQSY